MSKRGHYRDSALSSRERSVSSPGLRWIVMAVVVTLPWTQPRWALPFLGVLATTPLRKREAGKTPQDGRDAGTSDGEPAAPLASQCAYQADRRYRLQYPGTGTALCRSTRDADRSCSLGLGDPPTSRSAHQAHDWSSTCGWKTLAIARDGLDDPKTMWQRITVDWYGEGKRVVEICTATALWSRYGSDPLPIRWVLTRDPEGKRPPKALFSTDQSQSPEEIVLDFMKRWSLETTFEESHAHLGIETQRQWSDLAIERTTPLLFGLYSLMTLFGHARHPAGQLPLKQAAWYHKQAATFSDVLAVGRRHLWDNFSFPTSPTAPDVVLVPSSTLARLALAVCY